MPPRKLCYNADDLQHQLDAAAAGESQAVPGHYQFTGTFQGQLNGSESGNSVTITYNFTVLPTASFTATPPTNFPAIPGLSTWQTNMVNWNAPAGSANADFWCTNVTDTIPWWSLENGNFSGVFDIPGRKLLSSMELRWRAVSTSRYRTMTIGCLGDQNQNHLTEWQRCAELAMEPYGDTAIGTVPASLSGSLINSPTVWQWNTSVTGMLPIRGRQFPGHRPAI